MSFKRNCKMVFFPFLLSFLTSPPERVGKVVQPWLGFKFGTPKFQGSYRAIQSSPRKMEKGVNLSGLEKSLSAAEIEVAMGFFLVAFRELFCSERVNMV